MRRVSAARASLALLLAALLTLSVVPSASAGSNTWTRLAGVGQQVGGLAVAPSDPNLLLARTPRGLLRSTDRGRTWKLAGKRLGEYQPQEASEGFQNGDPWGWTVWIDPLDPRVVYSTLDESVSFRWRGSAPTAVYRSADGGRTWKRVLASDGGQVAIYGADPRIVYVAGQYGIWKSVDRGLTWSQVYYLGARDLAISPTNPNLVLAVAGDYVVASADGGKTWNSVGASESQSLPESGNSTVIVSGAGSTYWSADGGATWAFGSGWWVNPLAASELLRIASDKEGEAPGIVRSTDWGRSQSLLPLPPTQTWVQQLVLDRGSPQTMYALAEDGVWAYTLGVSPVGAGELPKTGSPDLATPQILAALAGVLSLVGLWLRRRRDVAAERAVGGGPG